MTQMRATQIFDLKCSECGEILYATKGLHATLYEHSQRQQILDKADTTEDIFFNPEKGLRIDSQYIPKGEASVNAANMEVSYSNQQKKCKNDGGYLVMKIITIGATFKK